MKKLFLSLILVMGISATGIGQTAPEYLGGGVNLATTTKTTSTTVGGGFVEGNYPFLSIFEVKGKMEVNSNSRFSLFQTTTIDLAPEMRMFVPLAKHVEGFVAGGINGQMLTGGLQDYFNPTATVGLRFAKAYDISVTRLFDTMNTNDTRMTGVRFSGNAFKPIRSNIALIAGFDYDKQLNTATPGSQFKARIGLALK